jgi:hypothetical protein
LPWDVVVKDADSDSASFGMMFKPFNVDDDDDDDDEEEDEKDDDEDDDV